MCDWCTLLQFCLGQVQVSLAPLFRILSLVLFYPCALSCCVFIIALLFNFNLIPTSNYFRCSIFAPTTISIRITTIIYSSRYVPTYKHIYSRFPEYLKISLHIPHLWAHTYSPCFIISILAWTACQRRKVADVFQNHLVRPFAYSFWHEFWDLYYGF